MRRSRSSLTAKPAVARGVLALAFCWLVLCAPAHAAAQRYYLALGGSHAFGFQFRSYFPGVPASALIGHADDVDKQLPDLTLTLWSNDINAFFAGCAGDFACVQAGAPEAIAKFSARLTAILAALRLAAGPRATIVHTGRPAPAGRSHAPGALDAAMQTVAAPSARYAAMFPVFDPDDSDSALCVLTLLCTPAADAHPSDAGYQAIADLILDAAGL
jgi:hypothetical protein